MDMSELLRDEHAKRERNWNPIERWRVIQETIAWVASQPNVMRNTPAKCREKEVRLLACMGGKRSMSA